jgi:hypothetical protein
VSGRLKWGRAGPRNITLTYPTNPTIPPAAPFFLFMHGKDITIPKGTEITAYTNGEIQLDPVKFAAVQTSPRCVCQLDLAHFDALIWPPASLLLLQAIPVIS